MSGSSRSLRRRLESYFDFAALGTSWRTEALAGLTTFLTMAYIILVNPAILKDAGMPVGATTIATCLTAAFGSILMGAYARYPIALAPGMGLNAYFAYSVVQGMGVDWRVALGAVLISGVAFFILTLTGIRQMIVAAIPAELNASVAVGIGLFIALIGLRNAGIVTASPATLVTLGNLRDPKTLLSLAGLALMSILLARGVRGAILIAIAITTIAALLSGQTQWNPAAISFGDLSQTAFQLDVAGALTLGAAEVIFVFLFVDLFDNVGTLVAVSKRANLLDASGRIPRVGRILMCDAAATTAGALAGTSTVVSYIESAAGVAAGGRSGVTAIVTGALFLLAIPLAPVAAFIPSAATAPALIIVGSLMMAHVAEIEWAKPSVALPAFLTIVAIPTTFSIANGLAFGFLVYVILKVGRGEGRSVHWFLYVMSTLFLLRFLYLGSG
jgi:AGZA family xanthine/uracil permease-like MFS transporter